jgi:hypothetical protein
MNGLRKASHKGRASSPETTSQCFNRYIKDDESPDLLNKLGCSTPISRGLTGFSHSAACTLFPGRRASNSRKKYPV